MMYVYSGSTEEEKKLIRKSEGNFWIFGGEFRSDKINARRSLRTLPSKKLEQIAAVKYCRRPLTGEALPE